MYAPPVILSPPPTSMGPMIMTSTMRVGESPAQSTFDPSSPYGVQLFNNVAPSVSSHDSPNSSTGVRSPVSRATQRCTCARPAVVGAPSWEGWDAAGWTSPQIRREEARRTVWAALGLAASHAVRCVVFDTDVHPLSIFEPGNVSDRPQCCNLITDSLSSTPSSSRTSSWTARTLRTPAGCRPRTASGHSMLVPRFSGLLALYTCTCRRLAPVRVRLLLQAHFRRTRLAPSLRSKHGRRPRASRTLLAGICADQTRRWSILPRSMSSTPGSSSRRCSVGCRTLIRRRSRVVGKRKIGVSPTFSRRRGSKD
jgi:hypothetical protein